jgi:outer membrane lipoprotein SlyB
MFRTPLIATLTVVLLGGTAMAQSANAPPADLSNSARTAPDYDDDDGYAPGLGNLNGAEVNAQRDADARARDARSQSAAQQDRDIFCRRDAAARTGYTTPREAARDEQTRGTVGGTLGGAALGAILGAAGGNAGLGAAAGAGAGLIAGTAIGADNARDAARNVEADYADAYYGCMHQDQRQAAYYDDAPPPPAYGYGYGPPPPPVYYPRPYYGGYYPYYGPSLSFGFGFGGGHRGWGHRGFHRGGGWRHR